MANNAKREFLVIKRWVNNADEVEAWVRMVITDVPSEVTENDIKTDVEKAGFDGEDDEALDFQMGYKVILSEDINGAMEGWKADALHYAEQIKAGRLAFLPNGVVDLFTYDELLDKLDDEKRFTLRLPIGLHTALVKAAKGKSLNKFCVDALAKSTDYKLSARESS